MDRSSFSHLRYAITISVGILIMILCLLPSSEFSNIHVPVSFADITVHFIMFFVFSAALYFDITKKKTDRFYKPLYMIIALCTSIGLGILTEMLQYLIVPLNRTGSLSDLLFDLLGSLLGIAMIVLIKRKSVSAS
jgi:VanZ family protein